MLHVIVVAVVRIVAAKIVAIIIIEQRILTAFNYVILRIQSCSLLILKHLRRKVSIIAATSNSSLIINEQIFFLGVLVHAHLKDILPNILDALNLFWMNSVYPFLQLLFQLIKLIIFMDHQLLLPFSFLNQ